MMSGTYLGPYYSEKNNDMNKKLRLILRIFIIFWPFLSLFQKISEGNVIGWFQGRMEFGPELGNRSILGDARNPDMQKKLNVKIKYRESFGLLLLLFYKKTKMIFLNWIHLLLTCYLFLQSRKKAWPSSKLWFTIMEKIILQ